MQIFQVTIGSSGVTQVFVPQPGQTNNMVQQIIIQNNAAHSIRVGDSTVSSSKGIAVATAGATLNLGGFLDYSLSLSDLWIAGTAGDVIDVLFI